LQLIRASRPLGCISVGYTWQFGHQREGNIHLLMEMGQEHDFAVYGVPPLKIAGAVVSSTLIREAIANGDFAKAATLLGRDYSVFGTVVEGQKLGRQLGFPTANVDVENEQLPRSAFTPWRRALMPNGSLPWPISAADPPWPQMQPPPSKFICSTGAATFTAKTWRCASPAACAAR